MIWGSLWFIYLVGWRVIYLSTGWWLWVHWQSPDRKERLLVCSCGSGWGFGHQTEHSSAAGPLHGVRYVLSAALSTSSGICTVSQTVIRPFALRLWGDSCQHSLHNPDLHIQVWRSTVHPAPRGAEAAAPRCAVCSPAARVEDISHSEDGFWKPKQGWTC